jgi:fumarate reductase subunit D
MKRSNAPVFWLLFGAGGMLSALLGAALVFLTGLAAPLSSGSSLFSYPRMLAFAQHPLGKAFLFAVVALFAWHGVHRIFHTMHDFGLHGGLGAKFGYYGLAGLITLIAGGALLAVGF